MGLPMEVTNMQRATSGRLHACCETKDATGFEVSFNSTPDGSAMVDMWKPDGENHWTKYFKTIELGLVEYNKWAVHHETV
jgi:hypothetical protein